MRQIIGSTDVAPSLGKSVSSRIRPRAQLRHGHGEEPIASIRADTKDVSMPNSNGGSGSDSNDNDTPDARVNERTETNVQDSDGADVEVRMTLEDLEIIKTIGETDSAMSLSRVFFG